MAAVKLRNDLTDISTHEEFALLRGERGYNALIFSLKVMEDHCKEAFRELDETKQSVETGGRATGRDQSGVD